MKTRSLCVAAFIFSSLAGAAPSLITGTPNYFGFGLSPQFGQLINFEDLSSSVSDSATGYYALPSGQYANQGVMSVSNTGSTLYAAGLSAQSGFVYLTTGPSDGYAGDMRFSLFHPVSIIGIGILSDDTTPVVLNALAADGSVLASYTVFTSSSSSTPENGYWAIQDSSADIRGLEVISTANLGVDDLQFAPEPASLWLIAIGAVLVAFAAIRKTARKGN